MEGISKEELRIQYESFENKPPIGFQIVLSNIAYLHSKGIVTNQIIGSTHYSFMLKCHQRTPQGIVILTVKMFLVNNYTSLSNSIELFENQIELKGQTDYIEPYESFCFNRQDEVMNYMRRGYYRYAIDQMYKLNSSFKNQGVLNRFDLIKEWIRQILVAVSHLHERGLYHGGIKASNVFIDESVNLAKLVDYGFNAQQVTMLHNTLQKDIYYSAVIADRGVSSEQKRFNDIYATIILIYQMCFGFDNTFHVIKQLQQGITFSENDDDRDFTEDDYYEYKYRIIKLINKIVCKAALGTPEQRKKITITYIQDVLDQVRNVESFQNSPTNIAEMLQCQIAQKIALSTEQPLDLNKPSQDYIRDSNTNLEQEELYLEELMYQQKRNEEEHNKQTQKQVYSNDNLSLQQKVDVYKKLDLEKYQKHSDSQKSSSNLSSGEKLKEKPERNLEGVQGIQAKTVETMIFSDIYQIEKEQQQQSQVDVLQQEKKLEELLKEHSKQKESLLNSQDHQNKEINIPSFTVNGVKDHTMSQPNYNFTIDKLTPINDYQNYCTNITQSTLNSTMALPTQDAQHTRFISNLEQEYQPESKIQSYNTEKSNVQSSSLPDEQSKNQQNNNIVEEKQEDFWVIDLSSSRNVQRGTDYHPKLYQKQVNEAVSLIDPEVDDIYTQANKNSTTFVSIQQALLKQLEPLNSQTQPNYQKRQFSLYN